MTRCTCAVQDCLNTSYGYPELKFYRIPLDPYRFNQWIKKIGRRDLAGRTGSNYYVCEAHFPPDAFAHFRNRQLLTRDAMPSLMLPAAQAHDDHDDMPEPIELVNKGLQCNLGRERYDPESSGSKSAPLSFTAVNKQLLSKRVPHRDTFDLLCDRLFPKDIADLVKKQADVKNKFNKNQFRENYKQFCLYFYHTSPAAYTTLQKSLSLPPKKILLSMCKTATIRGVSTLMQTLRSKFDCLSDLGKYCVILITEIKLKPHLYYHISEDKIYGFCERERTQTSQLATHAITVTIRGLHEQWTLPIDYAFVNNPDNSTISVWIQRNIITQLIDSGLKVRVCVSNMSSRVITETNGPSMTIEKPYFHVKDTQIFYAYDPTYLIKNIYWHFLNNHEFHFQGLVAKWQDVLQFYDSDSKKMHRLVPELSERHVRPSEDDKMDVRLAIETLSERVAAGISTYVDFEQMKASAIGTVKLFTVVSRLYKFMSSSKVPSSCEYQKPYCGSKFQIDFLVEALTLLRELKLIRNGMDVTSDVKILKQILMTIRAVMLLHVTESFPHIYTNNIRMDIMDNFLAQIYKKIRTKDVTPWKLVSVLRKMLFTNVFKTPKQKCCPQWMSEIFYNYLQDSSMQDSSMQDDHGRKKRINFRAAMIKMPVKMSDYKHFQLPVKDQLTPLCRFLLATCWENRHSACSLPPRKNRSHEYTTLYNQFKEKWDYDALTPIPINFLEFVKMLDNELKNNFNEYFCNHRLLKGKEFNVDLYAMFNPPCSCFPVADMVNLYFRLRISQQLKANNKRIKNCPPDELYFRFAELS